MTGTIAITELRRLFSTPLAWVLLGLVLFILALLFGIYLENFLTVIQPQLAARPGAPGVTDAVTAPLILAAGIILLAICPLLTMRSFSEERQAGTLILLTSAPVSVTQIVLGKYLSLVAFVVILQLLLGLMPLALALGTEPDWGKTAAAMLGLFLLVASFLAAGLYVSSLTTAPVLAAAGGFALLLFLFLLYVSGSAEATASTLFFYLSHFGHFLNFVEGSFSSEDLAYYLLFIVTFLVLTVRHLDNQRLQRTWK